MASNRAQRRYGSPDAVAVAAGVDNPEGYAQGETDTADSGNAHAEAHAAFFAKRLAETTNGISYRNTKAWDAAVKKASTQAKDDMVKRADTIASGDSGGR
jgi:hypothetical protein